MAKKEAGGAENWFLVLLGHCTTNKNIYHDVRYRSVDKYVQYIKSRDISVAHAPEICDIFKINTKKSWNCVLAQTLILLLPND